MALFNRTRDPAKAIEAELAAFAKQRASLDAHLASASAAVERANADRRRLLLETDALDGSAVSKAEQACLAAQSRADGLADALRHLSDQIADAEARLAGHRDRAERERIASVLEARAAAIDAVTAALADALSAAADAHADLTAVIGTEGMRGAGYIGIEPSALNYSTNIFLAGLNAALPALDVRVTYRTADSPPARTADAVASEAQSGQMRRLAAAIRSGEVPAAMPDPVGAAPTEIRIAIPDTTVVLKEPIAYSGLDGATVHVPHGGVSIPVPVAEAAVAKGIGFPPDSEQGLAIMREAAQPDVPDYARNRRPTLVRRGPPWTDVGVSLHAYVQAERQRRRAA